MTIICCSRTHLFIFKMLSVAFQCRPGTVVGTVIKRGKKSPSSWSCGDRKRERDQKTEKSEYKLG